MQCHEKVCGLFTVKALIHAWDWGVATDPDRPRSAYAAMIGDGSG